jgi:hypothetical protein
MKTNISNNSNILETVYEHDQTKLKNNINISDNNIENITENSYNTKSSLGRKKKNAGNDILITANDFTYKEKEYYTILYNFYLSLTDEELKLIYNIVTEKGISLRKFEWFAVRYSFFYKTSINVSNRFMDSRIYVHISYKAHLKTYHKVFFDIFRRSDSDNNSRKFEFILPDRNFSIITSISQLHFMRWILTHGIIKYVTENYEKIIEKEEEVDLYFKNKSERSKRTKNSKITKISDNSTNGSSIVVKRQIQIEI